MRWIYFILLLASNLGAQVMLEGQVIDAKRGLKIPQAVIREGNSGNIRAVTDSEGQFQILLSEQDLNLSGRPKVVVLKAEHDSYQTQFVPIDIEHLSGPLLIALEWQVQDHFDEVLSNSVSEYDDYMDQASVSGPLNAYGDPVGQAEQFDFGPVFYSPLGASRQQRGLIFQGMSLKDPFSGTIQWNMITGLNQAMRHRKSQNQFNTENEGFGALGGTTYVGVRPDEFNPGTRLKMQLANRGYQWGYSLQHQMSAKNGWSALMLVTARDGLSGLTRGVGYHALGGLLSIEKQISDKIHLGLLAAYTPVKRGMSAPLTKEVLRLKGDDYNPNWGWQDNAWRNSRERLSHMPMAVFSIYGGAQSPTTWAIHLGLISGFFGQSRLNYSSGKNPSGHHYTQLPSYFLRDEPQTTYDFYRAYLAQQKLQTNGQIVWPELYAANRLRPQGNSQYIIQNETSRRNDYQFRWYWNRVIRQKHNLSISVFGRWTKEQRFAEIRDLLGGNFYYDRNNFYQGIDPIGQWNNLDTVNRPLVEGDKIDYDYSLHGQIISGFGQYIHALRQGQMGMSLGFDRGSSRRVGHMRHGIFHQAGAALGPSDIQWHQAMKAKFFLAHYWRPKFSSQVSVVYDQELPLLDQTFVYSRYHNARTEIRRPAELMGIFCQFRYQSSGFDFVIKPYGHYQRNGRQSGFFYSDHVRAAVGQSGLVQQHLWNLSQLGVGIRSGIKVIVGERLTWTAVNVISSHRYIGEGKLFLSGTNIIQEPVPNLVATTNRVYGNNFLDAVGSNPASVPDNYVISDLDRLGSRDVYLKSYRPSIGPQQILHTSLTYRDPSFWWAGLVLSHFSDRYVGLSALRRSEDAFFQNSDELGPMNLDHLKSLWRQEKLPSVTLASLKMGVSWRLQECFVSLFASVQNLFDRSFVSGGFESSRKVYLADLSLDQQRPHGPLFGNKYFPGLGRSYYLTCSLNF